MWDHWDHQTQYDWVCQKLEELRKGKEMSEDEETVKVPEGYDCAYVLIGYNDDEELCCAECDRFWQQTNFDIDFIDIPERYAFFVKKDETRFKKTVHSFYLENGKIIPRDEKENGGPCQVNPHEKKRDFFGGNV